MTATLPKDAKIIATAVTGDRLVVTLDLGGSVQIRTFDLRTLRSTGTLSFAREP